MDRAGKTAQKVKARPEIGLIESKVQFQALSSELRMRLFSEVGNLEPCSVSEVAQQLGLAAEPLYYHFDIMVKSGLFHVSGTRGAGRCEQKLYECTADRFQFHPTRRDASFVQSLNRVYTSTLKVVHRNILRAFGHSKGIRTGNDRNVRMGYFNTKLDKDDIRELNIRLEAVRSFVVSRPETNPDASWHQVLLVTTPVIDPEDSDG